MWSACKIRISQKFGSDVNGAMVGSKPLAATNVFAAHKLRIGNRGDPASTGQIFDGRMGEVAIYMTVLSDSQILAHYTAGTTGGNYAATVQADSPMGWWRLGDLPAAVATADSGSGANNGVFAGSVIASAAGIPGAASAGAGLFQGGHAEITNRSAFDSGGNTLTVEAWVQTTTASGWIVGKDDNNINLDYLLGFWNGQFRFISQGLVNDLTAGVPVLDGTTWNHVVAVQDAVQNTITLYCNGTNAGSISYGPGSGILATRKLRIGARGSAAAQSVSGRIGHVAIYTNALSDTMVLAHYNAGISGSSYLATVTADSPLGWWRLGDAPPVTFPVADSGTGSNSGIGQGNVALAPGIPGAPDGAGDFQSGFVDIANPAALNSGGGPLTIEAWVQADSGTGWMVGKDDSNSALDYLLGFNGATFRFFSQTVAQSATSGSLLINGTAWHHAVAVQDPANQIARLYADGFLVASMTLTNSGITATNKLRLGARGSSASQSIRARLDEVAIYKGVLSDNRILAHYVAGIYPGPLTLQMLNTPDGLKAHLFLGRPAVGPNGDRHL